MASNALLKRLEDAQRDLGSVVTGSNFDPIRNMSALKAQYDDAEKFAKKWLARTLPLRQQLDDDALEPLVRYLEQIVAIADGRGRAQNEDIRGALARAFSQFKPDLSTLTYGLLEASGIVGLSEEDFPRKRGAALGDIESKSSESLQKIEAAVTKARTYIQTAVEEAATELEAAKAKANEISVKGAQDQFAAAAMGLRSKARGWATLTTALFLALLAILCWLLLRPPPLISSIVAALSPQSKQVVVPVSVPLLIAASAYFTSIRVALIGVLGIALAFSLRMTRAYFHMIEHNHHKSRVTNSIEAFVASVRTNEQKDLVLGKLVDSVTQFGDSGILDKEGDKSAAALPAVFFDAVTKNIGKS
jgi:hypothetical protein